jgi:hypothetical protein
LFQSLISHDWHKVSRPHVSSEGPQPDGRRPFGTVAQAIVQVLARADTELRVRDIHKQVEYILGEPLSYGSVKNYLHKGARRPAPLFEYRGRAGYRLIR